VAGVEAMGLSEAIVNLLVKAGVSLTPQEIRESIKSQYPDLYGTESHARNVEKGHYHDLDHALLAQIYSVVGTGSQFSRDRATRPMRVSLVADEGADEQFPENYEQEIGLVYILSTGLYTEDRKRIVKIGFTTQDLETRIAQLYSTGSPFRFEKLKVYKVKNYVELEQALHGLLAPYRLNKSREFFNDDALKFVDRIVQIHNEVQGDV
jgi:hypothetical protein